MNLEREYSQLRNILLGLTGVKLGSRFGEEAFFVGKRFFCHFHRGGALLVETFVWDKVDDVVSTIPGVTPHPQYSSYGWVRLRISSPADLAKAKKLIESSYQYVISTKRISLPKTGRVTRAVREAEKKFPGIRFRAKPSSKRTQVVIGVRNLSDAAEARKQLNLAVAYLRKN